MICHEAPQLTSKGVLHLHMAGQLIIDPLRDLSA